MFRTRSRGQFCGLCGHPNGDPSDDMFLQTAPGLPFLPSGSPEEFAAAHEVTNLTLYPAGNTCS